MDDWDSLRAPLREACEKPEDEDAIKRAVDAAELVASTAGEPPDELPNDARDWVETHGVPPDDLVALIGPIGWAALVWGLPVWTLVTAVLLVRAPRVRAPRTAPATA